MANTKETRVTVSQKQATTFFRSDDWPTNGAQRHVRLTPRNALTGLVTDAPEARIFQFGKYAGRQPLNSHFENELVAGFENALSLYESMDCRKNVEPGLRAKKPRFF